MENKGVLKKIKMPARLREAAVTDRPVTPSLRRSRGRGVMVMPFSAGRSIRIKTGTQKVHSVHLHSSGK